MMLFCNLFMERPSYIEMPNFFIQTWKSVHIRAFAI